MIHRAIVWTLALVLCSWGGAGSAGAQSAITVITYNFGKGGTIKLPRRKHLSPDARIKKLGRTLRRFNNVVVGLQEIDECTLRTAGADQPSDLRASISPRMRSFYLPKDDTRGGDICQDGTSGVASLTDGSVIDIAYPVDLGYSAGGRALAVKVDMNGKNFWFVNLHFHKNRPTVYKDIATLANWIRKNTDANEPMIIVGDFNVMKYGCHRKRGCQAHEERAYNAVDRTLRRLGFADISGDVRTFKPWLPMSQLDYVYTRNCGGGSLSHLFDVKNGLSDHRSIVLKVQCR